MAIQVNILKQTELCGRQFQVYGTPEEPLFLATQVAEIIGHSKASVMVEMVEDDEKLRETIFTSGQNREVWMLTEQGLYEVLMMSRKPIAKQFKRGVKHILREIRLYGSYAAQSVRVLPSNYKEALLALVKEVEEKESLQAKISEQAPKVAFANAMLASKNSCLVGELAKIISQNGYKIGQNRLFQYLRDNGYLGKCGEYYNIPNQRHVENGLFEVKRSTRSGSNGELYNITTTKVTPKGQDYFINKFLQGIEKPAL